MEVKVKRKSPESLFWLTAISVFNVFVIPAVVLMSKNLSSKLVSKCRFVEDKIRVDLWFQIWMFHGLAWALPILIFSMAIFFAGYSSIYDSLVIFTIEHLLSNVSIMMHAGTLMHFLRVFIWRRRTLSIALICFLYALFAIVLEFRAWRNAALAIKFLDASRLTV